MPVERKLGVGWDTQRETLYSLSGKGLQRKPEDNFLALLHHYLTPLAS